jgi:site-specific DNA-methyltransferase (adenine-specific)
MNISEWLEAGKPWNVILHGDCMDLMKHFNDKEIQLCIVDPPYGIGEDSDKIKEYNKTSCKSWENRKPKEYTKKNWDNSTPDENYFKELFRISKNQIIWGGNYFTDNLYPSGSWIIWDKQVVMPTFSDGEMAWCSIKNSVKFARFLWAGYRKCEETERFHPTQKPVALYRWLLQNYAKPGDKIIDTHSGSGSLACACHLEKFDFLAIEKDEDYYKSSIERLETLRSQGMLF